MKTVLITGTSKGIGHALATLFLANNYRVIGTSRSGSTEDLTHPNFEVLPLDLAKNDTIATFETLFKAKHINSIDILINNAAIGPDLNYDYPELTSFQQTFDVNVTGTTFFTEMMLKYVNEGGKVINISSKMGAIGVCEQSGSPAYRMSKTALNMYTKILTNRLKGKQVVAAMHPGWVQTTISNTNANARFTPEESATRLYDFIVSDFKTGTFWNVEADDFCEW